MKSTNLAMKAEMFVQFVFLMYQKYCTRASFSNLNSLVLMVLSLLFLNVI